jgi:hypothetical protein
VIGVAVHVAEPGGFASVRVVDDRPLGRSVGLDDPLAINAVPEHFNVEVDLGIKRKND